MARAVHARGVLPSTGKLDAIHARGESARAVADRRREGVYYTLQGVVRRQLQRHRHGQSLAVRHQRAAVMMS